MAQRLSNPAPRHFDDEGAPLSGGKLYFYLPGTTTAKDTYSDNALSVPNANPVVLSASGLQPDIFLNGSYRVILTDADDNEIWDRDNVNAIISPFSQWISSLSYNEGGDNIVTGSDGNYYISLTDDNLGNNPISSPDDWRQVSFLYGTEAAAIRASELGALTPANQAVILGTGTTWSATTLAAIVPRFIAGLELSNAADADHDITVSSGRANDSTDALSLVLSSAMTKQIDATWAAGNNLGGLASGATLGNATWYHVFLVTVGGVVDVMIDSSVTCANGVANNAVTNFRRIGSVLTDSSANIKPFIQSGDEFTWSTMIQDVNDADPGETAVTATLSVPTGVSVLAKYVGALTTSSTTQDGNLLFSALAQANSSPTGQNSHIATFAQTDTNTFGVAVITQTNASAQIRYRLEVTSTGTTDFTVLINTLGWLDKRGK